MKKHHIGSGYFIDWTSFPSLVMNYIKTHGKQKLGDPMGSKRIAQADTLLYIRKEYSCSWAWAKKKLQKLINQKSQLSVIDTKEKQEDWGPPPNRKYLLYKKI